MYVCKLKRQNKEKERGDIKVKVKVNWTEEKFYYFRKMTCNHGCVDSE